MAEKIVAWYTAVINEFYFMAKSDFSLRGKKKGW